MTTATTKTFLLDLGERAGKTFAQAALATVGAEFAGSGLSIANLPSLAVGEKIATAAIIAGGAAVLSLLTSVLSGLKTSTGSLSTEVAATAVTPGLHASFEPAKPIKISLAAQFPSPAAPEPTALDGLPVVDTDTSATEPDYSGGIYKAATESVEFTSQGA